MKPRSTPEFMKELHELLHKSSDGLEFERQLQSRDISPEHLNMRFHLQSLLICAVRKPNVRAVRLLSGYKGINCDIGDYCGQTALFHAASQGNTEMVDALLNAGAKPDVRDIGGDTALHRAASKRETAVALRLLNAKADPTLKNQDGITAFDYAYENIAYDVLHAIGLMCAFKNPTDDQHLAFFFAACAVGDEKMAAQLITKPYVKQHINDSFRNVPLLHYPIFNGGHRAIVRLLIAHGVNVNNLGIYSYTALMRATHNFHADIAEDLINAGAQLETPNLAGFTALELAVADLERNNPLLPMIKVLLKHGAVLRIPLRLHAALENTDQRDIEMQNVLHVLCERLNAQIDFAITDCSSKQKQLELKEKIAFRQKVDVHRMGLSALSMFRRRQVHNVICDSLTMMSRDVCGVVTGYVVDGSLFHLEKFSAKDIDQQLQKIAPQSRKR